MKAKSRTIPASPSRERNVGQQYTGIARVISGMAPARNAYAGDATDNKFIQFSKRAVRGHPGTKPPPVRTFFASSSPEKIKMLRTPSNHSGRSLPSPEHIHKFLEDVEHKGLQAASLLSAKLFLAKNLMSKTGKQRSHGNPKRLCPAAETQAASASYNHFVHTHGKTNSKSSNHTPDQFNSKSTGQSTPCTSVSASNSTTAGKGLSSGDAPREMETIALASMINMQKYVSLVFNARINKVQSLTHPDTVLFSLSSSLADAWKVDDDEPEV